MEILRDKEGETLRLTLRGRLDAYWSESIQGELDAVVRQGTHQVILVMRDVAYLSSAGLNVLLRFRKQLADVQGWLRIEDPSDQVRSVLTMVKLDRMFFTESSVAAAPRTAAAHRFEIDGIAYERYDLEAAAVCPLRVSGSIGDVAAGVYTADQCQCLHFPPTAYGLGVGAIGEEYSDCTDRFGEFIAAAGAAAYLPTDPAQKPDHIVAAGSLIPRLQVTSALSWTGKPAWLLRFESEDSAPPCRLDQLASAALTTVSEAGVSAVGMVIAGEVAGLVGVWLRRSLAHAATDGDRFTHPRVRQWFCFGGDRLFVNDSCLIVGVAASASGILPQEVVRPVGLEESPVGHFHAAAFSYRPLRKGSLALAETVRGFFESAQLRGVLHLLADDRPSAGGQQSTLYRGAAWLFPLDSSSEGSMP